ncbi:MAG: ABC transporter ATP-binding protein, partial [Thermodesulfobacteriota bacterium]
DASSLVTVTGLKLWFPIRRGLFRKTVGHVRAVDGVDLAIPRGRTSALVGESGCGKTTLGKTVLQLLPPTAGTVEFGGTELTTLARSALKPFRRRLQIVFQDPFSSLDPRMMVGEILMEGMTAHRLGRSRSERLARAEGLMDRVGLEPRMVLRYPHEFSGGQRQRIAIARCLAVDPEFIVCDEATSALDVSVQAQIINLLKKLQAELSLTYLFITHDLSVVEYLADEVCVMYLGRIVERGRTEEIFLNPMHPYTRALLSAVPQIDPTTGAKKIRLPGDTPSPVNPPPGCHFHPRCPEAMDRCSDEYPREFRFSETHSVCCWLYEAKEEGEGER